MFANYIPIPSEKNQLYRVFIVFQHYLTTTWKMQCKKKKVNTWKEKLSQMIANYSVGEIFSCEINRAPETCHL